MFRLPQINKEHATERCIMPDPKLKPIILDRSRAEQYETCPRQAYLSILWDVAKANATGYEVHAWEESIVARADKDLMARMEAIGHQSTTSKDAECGKQIHDLIHRAFKACENDLRKIPEWFVKNLPECGIDDSITPDLQPMAIEHARCVGDMISNYHIDVIGTEVPVSLVVVPETETSPAIVINTRIDLLGSGEANLHVVDWKTGRKKRENDETEDSFQAQFIALILFNHKKYTEVDTIHFWYYETMYNHKAYAVFKRDYEHPRQPGLTTLVAIKARVMGTVSSFKNDAREACPSPKKCLYCDMINFCPQAHMDAKEIADDTRGFVDSLLVLKTLCTRRTKALNIYLKAHGTVEGTKVNWVDSTPVRRVSGKFEDKAKPKGEALTGNDDLDGHFK